MIENLRLSNDELKLFETMLKDENQLKDLYKADYWEIPVDVMTFVKDADYVGNVTFDEDRKQEAGKIFPYWLDALQEVFSDVNKTEIILAGPIGSGKSTMADLALLYILYRIHCLKDPYSFYDKIEGKKFLLFLFSLRKELADSSHAVKLNQIMMKSPWFREVGEVRGKTDLWLELPFVRLGVGSGFLKGSGQQGDDVISGCFSGNMEITLSNGECKTYGELVGLPIQCVREDGHIVDTEIIFSGLKEIYEVELENGETIECTADQRFKIINIKTQKEDVKQLQDIDIKNECLLQAYSEVA